MPEELQDPPELLFGSEFYMDVFSDLNTERQSGMGMGRIPVSKILDYCHRYEFDDVTTYVVKQAVLAMDAAYIEYYADEEDKDG